MSNANKSEITSIMFTESGMDALEQSLHALLFAADTVSNVQRRDKYQRAIPVVKALRAELAARGPVLGVGDLPEELFDGYAVLKAIPEGKHVSADHVAVVLDAVVALIRNRTGSNLLSRQGNLERAKR